MRQPGVFALPTRATIALRHKSDHFPEQLMRPFFFHVRGGWRQRRVSFIPAVLAVFLLLTCTVAHSQDAQDTRLRLDQGIEREAAENEKALLKDTDGADTSTLVIDGRTYTVAHNVSAIGEALYIAVMRKQWVDVRRFLKGYLALPGHDPMLVLYARGALARTDGDSAAAERDYRALLTLQPHFLPGQLELARVLFENQEDRDAAALFGQIEGELDARDPKAAGVRKTIDSFLKALAQRRAWQGSFAFGPTWNDNLNQSSASDTCLLAGPQGLCLVERRIPAAVADRGLDFEGTLSKRFPLQGHSGLYLRTVTYGDIYDSEARYNQANLTAQAGYDYRTARYTLAVAPTFDTATYGPGILYDAWGMHAEGLLNVAGGTAFKLEADRKDLTYRQKGYASYTGYLTDAFATVFRTLPDAWTVFGGLDYTSKQAVDDTNAYLLRGMRLGITGNVAPGFNALLLASLRQRRYDAYSALLGARQRDIEQNYTLIFKTPKFQFAGLVPSLTLQFNRVRSNVDWLYSYERRAFSLKLEHTF